MSGLYDKEILINHLKKLKDGKTNQKIKFRCL